jgi:FtsH-binding integral membrane protein
VHTDVALTPVAIAIGYLVRYGVPIVCAAIAIDAARRPASVLSRRTRATWIAASLALLVTLVAGFVLPAVPVLRLAAVASLPLALVLGVVYLLTVVFPSRAPA